MLNSPFWLWPLALVYSCSSVCLAIYGLHSLWLLLRFLSHKPSTLRSKNLHGQEPTVLVQLPVYNERDVVERVLKAVGAFDWPIQKLRIQLLDDSTDDSLDIGRRAIEALKNRGFKALQLHRQDRTGFKAGALEQSLAEDAKDPTGPAAYVAIFDADFIPKPDFLKRALPVLVSDERLAFVQGRWEHLNRNVSILTRAQALGIDGHFAIEQAARARSGLALNFNGTCGVWRREAIAQSGGWQHDTLTEDLDLSYRAHLAGWRAEFCLDLDVPGECPATLDAWRAQQYRWARGSLQTARKLLPSIWRSEWSLTARLGATLHLTHYLIHPLIILNLILAPLVLCLLPRSIFPSLGVILLIFGMLPPPLLYIASQRVLGNSWKNLLALPALTAIGTGIAVSNTKAALDAFFKGTGVFERTPKQGDSAGSYRSAGATGLAEMACALWGSLGVLAGTLGQASWLSPVMLIYVMGFAHHGIKLFSQRLKEALPEAPFFKVWPLIPAGLLSCSALNLMVFRESSWREEPVLFTALALAMGVGNLWGWHTVQQRPVGKVGMFWIFLVSLIMLIAATGLNHSDDVNRYITEGQQILHGINPYSISPQHPQSLAIVEANILRGVNHPEMTAIYPPLALGANALIAFFSPTPFAFSLAFLGLSIVLIILVSALLLDKKVSPALIIATAWNPVLILFAVGEAHNDILMACCLALTLLLRRQPHLAWVCFALAVLAKPFALAILPVMWRRPQGFWLFPLVIGIGYLPFMDAGYGLVDSLLQFGGDMHFHGALEPVLRWGFQILIPTIDVALSVRLALVFLLGVGSVYLWNLRRLASSPTLALRLMALLLLCSPTLHPWYFCALLPFLPFARATAIPLWTAGAGIYWLHGLQMLSLGEWTETPWVTALAHGPAIALMAWEAFGPFKEVEPSEDLSLA
jgi:cellulose synthase/poly-beta-1,6-N-acetylglucosamine synthase-like glycosyltransferase